MEENDPTFDTLVADALAQNFSGWDFSYLKGRWHEDEPPWDYTQIVREAMPAVHSMLDMGTGGGEFLSSLAPLPPQTAATEAYAPNIPIAQSRLEPLGVKVYPVEKQEALPFAENSFDLVINRHAAFHRGEIYRILKKGGWFITQQVGPRNNTNLNGFITGEKPGYWHWSIDTERRRFQKAGFGFVDGLDAYPETRFFDIGAVVFYLRAIPWQIPGFNVERHREGLLYIHRMIEKDGYLSVSSHRFWLAARKTDEYHP